MLAGSVADRTLELNALLIASRDERGPGWGVRRRIRIVVGEPHSFAGEPIEVRRFHVGRTVAAQIAIPRSSAMIRTMFGRLATACCADASGTLRRKTVTASVQPRSSSRAVLSRPVVRIRGVSAVAGG